MKDLHLVRNKMTWLTVFPIALVLTMTILFSECLLPAVFKVSTVIKMVFAVLVLWYVTIVVMVGKYAKLREEGKDPKIWHLYIFPAILFLVQLFFLFTAVTECALYYNQIEMMNITTVSIGISAIVALVCSCFSLLIIKVTKQK